MAKKFITHEKDNDEAWTCICGNRPDAQGFYPCDEKGNEMEPLKGSNGTDYTSVPNAAGSSSKTRLRS